jgi:hypothetical protein
MHVYVGAYIFAHMYFRDMCEYIHAKCTGTENKVLSHGDM